MKKILIALALSFPLAVFAQWKTASLNNASLKQGKEKIEPAGLYSFDTQVFKQQLLNVPDRFSNQPGKIISIPNAAGKMEGFKVWEASNFAPELQQKFPDIRSYIGIGIDDPNAYLRFSLSPQGIQTMTLRPGASEFIEPYTVDNSRYIVFSSKKHRESGAQSFECKTAETSALSNEVMNLVNNSGKSSTGVFKTFRLAQSCTGEYGVYFGGTVAGAMAGINATLTRVNGVFEKDFAIGLILVANNEQVVYTNPSTDPYSAPSGMNSWNAQVQSTLNSKIGAANYDIGHLFGRSGGGGNAGCIGCVCNNSNKGSGITSPGSGGPEGDNFDIDYVAHEMGHQLGANHTFSFNYEGTGANVEPGSGSSIMGYAGITSYDVQAHSDDYFTYKSIQQVQTNLQNKSCAVNTAVSNQTPIANAGSDYTIPKGTAFKLTGTASDGNGDALLYNWEQYDSGTGSTTGSKSKVSFTKTTGPNFRTLPHQTVPYRYFPKLDYVLNTDVTASESYWQSKWEAVTNVQRTFNFSFTVRDNNPGGPQTATGTMKVTVANAGPFKVTSPTENQTVNISSGSMTVQWAVASTNLSPVNTQNVKILFSTDNGATFTTLKASTPNDGSEVVNFPQGTVAGNNARIMIEAVGNIYYAVSRKFNLTGQLESNYTITTSSSPANGGTTTGGGTYANGSTATVTATANNGYSFVRWSENGTTVSSNPAYNFTVSGNRNLTAEFNQNFTISTTSSPAEGGTTTGGGTYANGSTATVTATANNGYSFVRWSENGTTVSSNPAYSFTVSGDRNLTAEFNQNFTISTTSSPAEGGATTGDGTYANGSTATVTATPNNGYSFVNWSENGTTVSSNPAYSFTVSGNRNLTAEFNQNSTISTTSLPANGGNTTGGGAYANGSTATVTATANNGYSFVNWSENGITVSTNPSFSFIVSGDRSLTAKFKKNKFTITTSSSPAEGGSTVGTGTYQEGVTRSVRAIPNPGYLFESWMEGNTVVASTKVYSFVLTANRSLTAVFTKIDYTLTTKSTPLSGGTTNGGGIYGYGDTATVTATANQGYVFDSWLQGTTVVATTPSYSFTITGNRKLKAKFVKNNNAKFTLVPTNENAVQVYPNPFTDFLMLNAGKNRIESIELYDLSGKLILNKKADRLSEYQLDTRQIANGNYLLLIRTDKGVESVKVFKK